MNVEFTAASFKAVKQRGWPANHLIAANNGTKAERHRQITEIKPNTEAVVAAKKGGEGQSGDKHCEQLTPDRQDDRQLDGIRDSGPVKQGGQFSVEEVWSGQSGLQPGRMLRDKEYSKKAADVEVVRGWAVKSLIGYDDESLKGWDGKVVKCW